MCVCVCVCVCVCARKLITRFDTLVILTSVFVVTKKMYFRDDIAVYKMCSMRREINKE